MPGVPGTPSGDPISTRYPPKHFTCPNTIVLYMNLYLSTISRLLVMSVISSGTPNNLRSPKHITHNTNRHRTLSVQPYGSENYVDMTGTRFRSITNSGTWMLYWLPHILRRSLLVKPHNNIRCSLCHRYVTCPRSDRRYLNT